MTTSECACGCGRPAPGAALAPQCAAALRAALRRLPALDRDLEDHLNPLRTGFRMQEEGKGEGLPYHEPAAECRSQIRHDLEYWTAQVLRARRPGQCLPGTGVPAMAGWLCGQVAWIAGRPWSADMLAALAADCGRARALLDPMPRAQIPIGRDARCPQCTARGSLLAIVFQADGDRRPAQIECTRCDQVWDTTQWHRLGHVILQQKAA